MPPRYTIKDLESLRDQWEGATSLDDIRSFAYDYKYGDLGSYTQSQSELILKLNDEELIRLNPGKDPSTLEQIKENKIEEKTHVQILLFPILHRVCHVSHQRHFILASHGTPRALNRLPALILHALPPSGFRANDVPMKRFRFQNRLGRSDRRVRTLSVKHFPRVKRRRGKVSSSR